MNQNTKFFQYFGTLDFDVIVHCHGHVTMAYSKAMFIAFVIEFWSSISWSYVTFDETWYAVLASFVLVRFVVLPIPIQQLELEYNPGSPLGQYIYAFFKMYCYDNNDTIHNHNTITFMHVFLMGSFSVWCLCILDYISLF